MKHTPFIAKVYIEYYSYFGSILLFGDFLRLVIKPPKRQKYYYLEEYIEIDMLYNNKLPLDDSCFSITPEGEKQFKEKITSILKENRLYFEEPLLQKQIDKYLKRWKHNKETKKTKK